MLIRQSKALVWLAAFLLAFMLPAAAQEFTPDEIQASYVLKMRPFIMVGSPPHLIQKICYYEKPGIAWNESVGQIIAKLAARSSDPHVSVEWFKAIRDFSGCDLLYIPADEGGNVDNILASVDSSSTLIVSNSPQFIFKGGMIGFVLNDANQVKMLVNLKNAKAKGVQIDPQMLELSIVQQVVNQ